MWPEAAYRAKPWLCIATGGTCALQGTALFMLSGALLVAAGAGALYYRKQNRRR